MTAEGHEAAAMDEEAAERILRGTPEYGAAHGVARVGVAWSVSPVNPYL